MDAIYDETCACGGRLQLSQYELTETRTQRIADFHAQHISHCADLSEAAQDTITWLTAKGHDGTHAGPCTECQIVDLFQRIEKEKEGEQDG